MSEHPEAQGMRLDKALMQLRQDWSLRAARRAIGDGMALVNGKASKPGYRLKSGDDLTIRIPSATERKAQAHWIGEQQGFLFFYKPRGLHTAAINGRPNESLEAQLREITPEQWLERSVYLLNRLDWGTAGIVAGVTSDKMRHEFRLLEREGRCEKNYVAVIRGILNYETSVKNSLLGNNFKRVKMLRSVAPPHRWTTFIPLGRQADTTLVKCRIQCGQRHQIRAHASGIGHPLCGDSLYGDTMGDEFILEHYRMECPLFSFVYKAGVSALAKEWPGAAGALCL